MSTELLRFTLSLDTSGVDTGAAKAAKSGTPGKAK